MINATYDWVDTMDATGYVLFHAVCYPTVTNYTYSLVRSTFMSDLFGTAAYGDDDYLTPNGDDATAVAIQAVGDGTLSKQIDLDFDSSLLQLPRTLEGTAIVRCGIYLNSTANGDAVYVIAKLRKWDGASETEIASVQSENLTITGAAAREFSVTLPMTVPRTLVKKGEQIRLTMEVWCAATISATEEVVLAHFPLDTDTTSNGFFTDGNTDLTLLLPFKLDYM